LLQIIPISFRNACEFVNKNHRHHKNPQGHKFSIAAAKNDKIIGVVICGRPVSRILDDGFTLEVTRCCTDGTKNACSFLYATAWRIAKNMGYKKLITYILDEEKGSSLKAAGFKEISKVFGRSWSCKSRPRIDKMPIQDKKRFEIC